MDNKVGFTPFGDNLLVTMEEAMEKTEGGLLLPEMSRNRPQYGVVVAQGASVAESRVGDRILFEYLAGRKVTLNSVEYLIMSSRQVLGKVEKDVKVVVS